MSKAITITINRADIGFLLEAIELRSSSMIESIMGQVLDIMQPKMQPEPKTEWTVTTNGDGGMVASVSQPAKKRGRQRKDSEAPFGRKKDGTPKKRPGRPSTK